MELVVGLDVAKGASAVQAFLGRNESYGILESISTWTGEAYHVKYST
nr:hypothetical protein [Paenibacillus polymyxa]